MNEKTFRDQLYDAFKHRALLYFHFFDELRKEIGEDRAAEIVKRAIYCRGTEVGHKFAKFSPGDMEGLKDAFIGGIPDNGGFFDPEIQKCDDTGLDIKFHSCPFLEAWKEGGGGGGDIGQIAPIAGGVGNGNF